MNSRKIPVFGTILEGVNYQERVGAYAFLLDGQKLAVVETPNGLFLPGGGAEPGETVEQTLHREVFEELGLEVERANLIAQAIQYHWSDFYSSHFKKVGSFFEISVGLAPVKLQKDHCLHWHPLREAARTLSQEFQRWAVSHFSKFAK